jgi:hypothetical protein
LPLGASVTDEAAGGVEALGAGTVEDEVVADVDGLPEPWLQLSHPTKSMSVGSSKTVDRT